MFTVCRTLSIVQPMLMVHCDLIAECSHYCYCWLGAKFLLLYSVTNIINLHGTIHHVAFLTQHQTLLHDTIIIIHWRWFQIHTAGIHTTFQQWWWDISDCKYKFFFFYMDNDVQMIYKGLSNVCKLKYYECMCA